MTSRVWVTGVGAVSSLGNSREEFWTGLVEGKSGVVRLDNPLVADDRFYSRIGAPVKWADNMIAPKEKRVTDRCAHFALTAALEALADAGYTSLVSQERKPITIAGVDPERFACVVGTGNGGFPTGVANCSAWVKEHKRNDVHRFMLPMLIPNAISAQVAIWTGARGECKSISTACSAGTMAIGDAYRLIRDGEADVAICGGAEAALSDEQMFAFLGFDLLRVMSSRNDDPTHACRPFDLERDGFVLGEGSGMIVLESEAHAKKRGADPYAILAGYGATCDAFNMVQIDADGKQIERAMKRALDAAGVSANDVGYVNAHGTATKWNDAVESKSIENVYGDHAKKLMVSSIKAATGHAIAASGALECIATALAIDSGVVPPTLNLTTPDPACRLDYVPKTARREKVKAAMSNSFAFGGHNACVVLQAP
jgi:3-oxoacyl-[acyl-carrier-protein] synthase II